MKLQKKDVLKAINEILKTKERYRVADVVEYFAAQNMHTTRKDVIDSIVRIIQGENKHQ